MEGLVRRKLGWAGYVCRKVADAMVTGGLGVAGNCGTLDLLDENRVLRTYPDVNFMIPEESTDAFEKAVLQRNPHMVVTKVGGDYKNKPSNDKKTPNKINVEKGDLILDATVMYPLRLDGKDYFVFRAPYKQSWVRAPKEFMYSVPAKLKGVEFRVLNPSALYTAKISFGNCERDIEDSKHLLRVVDDELREKMLPFA